jgi:hypothetical protein
MPQIPLTAILAILAICIAVVPVVVVLTGSIGDADLEPIDESIPHSDLSVWWRRTG